MVAANSDSPQLEDTYLRFTNTHRAKPVKVAYHFIDEIGHRFSSYRCLGPAQTMGFAISEYINKTKGYLILYAINDAGLPISFNWLIGNEQVRLAAGHQADLLAVSFQALYGTEGTTLPGSIAGDAEATLFFDGTSYNGVASQVALDRVVSPLDGNQTMIVANSLGGDLVRGSPQCDKSASEWCTRKTRVHSALRTSCPAAVRRAFH